MILSLFISISCSSDDNNSSTSAIDKDSLIGKWEHTTTKIFTKKKKSIGKVKAEDKWCGVLILSFTDGYIIANEYSGRNSLGDCIEAVKKDTYTILNNRLYTGEDMEKALEISKLNNKELHLLYYLEDIIEDMEPMYAKLMFKRVN